MSKSIWGGRVRGAVALCCAAGLIALISACSSGGDGEGTTPAASAPPLTGTFVDAPVAKLPYATSSGLSGVTDGQGQFNYRAGDTITFSYGQTTIGTMSIPTARQITPWTVFGLKTPDPADRRWVNLGRALQTFNNQLPLITPAIAGVPPIDFSLADADFAADSNVGALLTAMGSSPGALVTTAQAIATMQQQFAILGSWSAQSGPSFIVFTAMADGTFMFSEDGTNDPNGVNGMERGTYTWNPATGAFISTVQTDTNREWGLSDDGPVTVTVTGNTLVATVRNGDQFTFTRVVDTNGPVEPIVGAWRFDDTDGPGSLVVLTLFENGSFVLVQDESLPTSDGTERGTYSVAPNGDVTFTRILDTSPTAGLFSAEDPGPVVLNIVVSGDTLTLNDGEEIFRGTRIRAPQ